MEPLLNDPSLAKWAWLDLLPTEMRAQCPQVQNGKLGVQDPDMPHICPPAAVAVGHVTDLLSGFSRSIGRGRGSID
eukprot:2793153-Pyramimonas_sp.AAC.1